MMASRMMCLVAMNRDTTPPDGLGSEIFGMEDLHRCLAYHWPGNVGGSSKDWLYHYGHGCL
jgi:hypothetical protein